MSQNAISGAFFVCKWCKAHRPKKRRWQEFCSPKCRKAAWAAGKAKEIAPDIRAILNRIEGKVDRLLESGGLS